jgi:predicted kinase
MQSMRPTLYILCGLTGSGKTTLARQLEAEHGAVRFSVDEWMIALHGLYPGDDFDKKEERCKSLIRHVAHQLVAKGISVIFDFGFFRKAGRDACRAFAEEIGATPETIYVACNETELRRRLAHRNEQLPENTFEITDEMFGRFLTVFEPPEPDEAKVIRTDSQ